MKNFKISQHQVGPMQNYIYFLQNTKTHEVFVVDPAWDVPFIHEVIKKKGQTLKGILVTHFHRDHNNGLEDLLKIYDVPVYISQKESAFYSFVGPDNLVSVSHQQKLSFGDIVIECLHTPGHSPGSQCFKIGHHLVSGDTLFLDGCGRCDLPGGNVEDLYYSLKNVLMKLDEKTIIYPGHNYHHLRTDCLKNQKQTNDYLKYDCLKNFINKRLPS